MFVHFKKVSALIVVFLIFPCSAFCETIYEGYYEKQERGSDWKKNDPAILIVIDEKSPKNPFKTIKSKKLGAWWSMQIENIKISKTCYNMPKYISFDLYIEHSLNIKQMDNGNRYYFYKSEMLKSGSRDNNISLVTRRIPPNGHYRFILSSDTGLEYIEYFRVRIIGDQNGDFVESRPLIVDEVYSDFGKSGETKYWEGSGAISLKKGANIVEVQTIGDDIYFTTDGKTPPSKQTKYLAEDQRIHLNPCEWKFFWYIPAGHSKGALIVTQWTASPM